MATVSIIYGFTEGPWHGRLLRRQLRTAGFGDVVPAAEADIIIAHSGACFTVPSANRAKLVLLVGVPSLPDKRPVKNLAKKVRQETKDVNWLVKMCFNSWYFVAYLPRWFNMLKAYKAEQWPATNARQQVVIVRNKDDHPEQAGLLRQVAKSKEWEYTELNGLHDDIWFNPNPYVELINKLC